MKDFGFNLDKIGRWLVQISTSDRSPSDHSFFDFLPIVFVNIKNKETSLFEIYYSIK